MTIDAVGCHFAMIGLNPRPTAGAQRDDESIALSEPHPIVAPQRDDLDTTRTVPPPTVAPQHDAVDIPQSGSTHTSPPSIPVLISATTLAPVILAPVTAPTPASP